MPRKTTSLEAVATIGVDIGKNTFHLIGLDKKGAIVLRQKLSRGHVEARLANMPPCLIGMEACVGAHHLSRQLKALGHDARLMPARYVRPYSKGQKNDFRDAEAIAEAVLRPTMKFVATKTVEQLDLQALHRVRERLVCQRTSVINQIRAFLLERGIAVRQGLRALRTEMPIVLAMTDKLSPRMIHMLEDLCTDWHYLDGRIETVSNEIETLSEQDDGARRLMTVPGIGPIISTATVAAIGTVRCSPRAEISALGLGLCRDRCRPAGARSSGPSPSAAIATCGCCSSRRPAPYSCAHRAGRSMASNPGSRLQPGGSIASSWRLRSPIKSPASPGAFSMAVATSRSDRWGLRPKPRESTVLVIGKDEGAATGQTKEQGEA